LPRSIRRALAGDEFEDVGRDLYLPCAPARAEGPSLTNAYFRLEGWRPSATGRKLEHGDQAPRSSGGG
jgi:hypothetical protein